MVVIRVAVLLLLSVAGAALYCLAALQKNPTAGAGWDPKLSVRWFAPFFSGGGYCSEAISYISELTKVIPVQIVQHGDSPNQHFLKGLPSELLSALMKASTTKLPPESTVDICHSEPGAWSVPTAKFPTSRCPSGQAIYTIGRTMFETDRLPDGWPQRLQAMDEVWVPTHFHHEIFAASGVAASALHVIPEAVDTHLFDPSRHQPLPQMSADPRFKFLSIFKWEARKGWDVLLRAFFEEFLTADNVALYIRTTAYHSSSDFERQIARFAQDELGLSDEEDVLKRVVLLTEELPLHQLPQLYAGADCFVLPSRGEGWGRPHIEAMAMGVPVMATNWSGNTEFMKADNSFLVPIEGLEPVTDGPFAGHRWARPSVQGLRRLMRQVHTDPAAARQIGKVGSQYVRERYNSAAVAEVVTGRLREIESKLLQAGKLWERSDDAEL